MIRTAGGIDLQLLGIGHNGHIAFNEPGSPPNSRTRVINLAEDTIRFNADFSIRSMMCRVARSRWGLARFFKHARL